LMSYPFTELSVHDINYCPQDDNANCLPAETTTGTAVSPFYDVMVQGSDTTTPTLPISRGDGLATRLWSPTPVNELGQPAKPNENSYLLTWTVERGGSRGTKPAKGDYGIPGPYEVRLVVTAIWSEKGDALKAKKPYNNFVDGNDNLIAGRRSTIEGMRELSAASQL